MAEFSVVEIFSGPTEGHRCGYCKSASGSLSYGMWAHTLTVQDYQDLIDRGWRRSGKYCYRPIMQKTCCPSYTIKCGVEEFKLTKSQKKVLRRMHRFLSCGDVKDAGGKEFDDHGPSDGIDPAFVQQKARLAEQNQNDKTVDKARASSNVTKPTPPIVTKDSTSTPSQVPLGEKISKAESQTSKGDRRPVKGAGPDPNKPPCKKAKLIRLERKLRKEGKQSTSELEQLPKKKESSQAKLLEDHLSEPLPPNAAHRLEIKVVRNEPPSMAFQQTFEETCDLYKQYQMTVHKDPPDRCTASQFKRFLVNSPLESEESSHPQFPGYGSFHQQYWLDGRLIAVGVIDILPNCLSSVYFYYDSKYSFLSLGTYGALREIAFTRQLSQLEPSLQYYYMGYYIHSCLKMRYKGQFSPSHLLCPEVNSWHPIENVRAKLDASKYSRLNDNPTLEDEDGKVDVQDVMVLNRRSAIPYLVYLSLKHNCDSNDDVEVVQYAQHVGKKCVRRMLLYRQ